ncbi:FAD/NAD(P)-binding domain-containing protein [Sistotremastrum suecicum HHB10207 ss-3]|uniref:Electron transfer flavoprotein-ubiquinone oxidoreductase n=1 Tax=Sistotremastrum suecicum HHB10207 ss-3 TaxID=1314776 RepID=A0A166F202_9AGAM|nr:FAD/NAD(P)-binding domain-containing protein [Sistotremastrum suecicum HHB10207 ss-3]
MLRCRLIAHVRHKPRALHTSSILRNTGDLYDPTKIERPSDEVDVCIVGAGPAGLSAAIRLKQLEKERGDGKEIRVVVLEKGAEVGSHILSGAVIEPRALNELLPDWKSHPSHPLTQPATHSSMRFLTEKSSFPMPHPPQMSNKGNYIVSLSRFTAWLGSIAEEMGVEIYPGFGGSSILYTDPSKKVVKGVVTNDVGISKSGHIKDSFEPGLEFHAKATLLAEGAHGSLTKTLVKNFDLREGKDPQTYGIGVKEVWRVSEEKWKGGEVVHTMGWPLDWKTYGGGWVYHMSDGLVSLGLVVGLDYANPYLSPYREFQRMKHHPYLASLLEGGERLAYGARTLNEGGLQSIPRLHFPGGALIGCSAGFLNVPKIKGTHNAMKSGMIAAENVFEQLQASSSQSEDGIDLSGYEEGMKKSWVWEELKEVRNLRPSFNTRLGLWGGIAYSGIDSLILKGRTPWTLRTKISDARHTKRASECQPIVYPPPQPPLSTDLLTSLSLTSTNHEEDQPSHLRIRRPSSSSSSDSSSSLSASPVVLPTAEALASHVQTNTRDYASLLGHACPAGVYEYVEASPQEEGSWKGKKLVINAQNCIHCKLCDIKVPTQDIQWTVPEGGGGPGYSLT